MTDLNQHVYCDASIHRDARFLLLAFTLRLHSFLGAVIVMVEYTAECEAHSTRNTATLGDADALVPDRWCSPSKSWFYMINIRLYLQKALPMDSAFDFTAEKQN